MEKDKQFFDRWLDEPAVCYCPPQTDFNLLDQWNTKHTKRWKGKTSCSLRGFESKQITSQVCQFTQTICGFSVSSL